MIKKWLSVLLSLAFAAGIVVSLLVFPNAASDVQSQICLTDLTVTLNGTTVYKDVPPTITANTNGVSIMDGSSLSFTLNWAVIDPGSYDFQAGDYFTIPVMTTQGFSAFPTQSTQLIVNGVCVADGTFKVTNNADGSATLAFVVTFNAAAASKTIINGYANGAATVVLLKDGNGAYIKFEDSETYTYFPQFTEPPPPDTGGGSYPPYVQDTPGSWQTPVQMSPPSSLLSKAVTYPSVGTGNMVGDLNDSWPALPGRGADGSILTDGSAGINFPGFQWQANFYGQMLKYEQNPQAGPSGYMVMTDTISSNMTFSNFGMTSSSSVDSPLYGNRYNTSGTSYGDGTRLAPAMPDGKTSIENDFFTVPILLKSFGNANGKFFDVTRFGYVYGNYGYLPQSQLTQICDSQSDPLYNIYSSMAMTVDEVNAKYGTAYTDSAEAVKSTPLSYTVVNNNDGTSALIVNIGQLGSDAAGQSMKATDLYFPSQPNTSNITSMLNNWMSDFNQYAMKVARIQAGLDTPYSSVMAVQPLIDSDLASYWPGTAKAALFSTQRTINVNGMDYYQGYSDAASYTAAYNAAMADWAQMKSDAAAYMQGGDTSVTYAYWNNGFMYNTYAMYTQYSALRDFFFHIQGCDMWCSQTLPNSYWSLPYGTADQASMYVDVATTCQLLSAYDAGLQNYAGNMNNLPSYLATWTAYRDGVIKAAMFYFPQLRTFFAEQFGLDLAALDTDHDGYLDASELSDADVIATIIGDGSMDRMNALFKTPASPAYADGQFTCVSQNAFGFYGYPWGINQTSWSTYDWVKNSGLGAWIADGHPITQFQANIVGLVYRSIMTDTSVAKITNSINVTVGDSSSDQSVTYTYKYAAGIYAIDKGGAAFVKADAYANDGAAGWSKFAGTGAVPLQSLQATKGIAGATFSIYATQTDAIAGTNPIGFTLGSDGTSYTYAASGGVTQIITGDTGNFVLIGFPSASATYWIKEIGAPTGYYPDSDPYAFTLTSSGSAPACYALYDAPSLVHLLKTDSATSMPLPDAQFELYTAGGAQVTGFTQDAQTGDYVYDTAASNKTLQTGADGTLTVLKLPPGDYYFLETQAPTGYITPTGASAQTAFTIGTNAPATTADIPSVTVQNIAKPPPPSTFDFSFIKTDENGNPLAGTSFALYAAADMQAPFATASSDVNGKVLFDNVPAGDYVLVETATLPAYQLPAGRWLIDIADSTGAVTITAQTGSTPPPAFRLTDGTYYLPNYLKMKLPASGTDATILFTIGGAVLVGAAAGLWLAGRRRKRPAAGR